MVPIGTANAIDLVAHRAHLVHLIYARALASQFDSRTFLIVSS
jgi:hypothetical protein